MGQLLSREDEEDHENQTSPEDHEVHEEKEKPKRRQRNIGPALRSRRTKLSVQGRTRRSRANAVTFEGSD